MGRHAGSGIRLLDALPEDGERRLMLAVLMDAIRILRQSAATPRSHSRSWEEERRWLESEEHRKPFAFVSICNSLGIQPEYVRRCVLGTNLAPLPMNGRRYSAKTEDAWNRLRRPRQARVAHRSRSNHLASAAAIDEEVIEEGDAYPARGSRQLLPSNWERGHLVTGPLPVALHVRARRTLQPRSQFDAGVRSGPREPCAPDARHRLGSSVRGTGADFESCHLASCPPQPAPTRH